MIEAPRNDDHLNAICKVNLPGYGECAASGSMGSSGSSGSSCSLEQDRRAAVHDLETDSYFRPLRTDQGPYTLTLSVQDNRLVIEMENANGEPVPMLVLSLKPYKRLIKDYFMIVRSYDEAMREGKPSRLEAIDMGRRGLHNEGADLLIDRLADKVQMDHATARRLFTLICVLHESKAMIWRG
tara:strand:+ start:3040 stop:3588 length:549 start_codon:yes stop_codon:yes gene_type:complete